LVIIVGACVRQPKLVPKEEPPGDPKEAPNDELRGGAEELLEALKRMVDERSKGYQVQKKRKKAKNKIVFTSSDKTLVTSPV